MMTVQEKYEFWRKNVQDRALQEQLEKMETDEVAKENAFFKDLAFGTGGLRGVLGVGSNCLNIHTIGKITQGIASYMIKKGMKSVAISYDSRLQSDEFARYTAAVFAQNGIRAHLTKELMPTPFLSYITRALRADIGVMITASHNPSKYNGYKVYGSDGCQITDAAVEEIFPFIEGTALFSEKVGDFEELIKNGRIQYVSEDLTEGFLGEVLRLCNGAKANLKVTYSALNGTGYKLVPEALFRAGFTEVELVQEQSYPDGYFRTCPYPNPEKKAALELGLAYAKRSGSDILLATDPDCDRVGIAVKNGETYELLSGNEVGVLLTDYLLKIKKAAGTLPKKPVVVKTIVTTDLVKKIGAEYGVELMEVLTGFKYIGECISALEKEGRAADYLIGFEESYGYLTGTHVRDKDGVNGALAIIEMTAYYKKQGLTLVDRLAQIYEKYGLYEQRLLTYSFEGASGNAEMKKRLKNLRENLPDEIMGVKVERTVDYLTQTLLPLPKADVLSFELADGSKVIVRPSGTEPLIKTYLSVCFDKKQNAARLLAFNAYLDGLFAN